MYIIWAHAPFLELCRLLVALQCSYLGRVGAESDAGGDVVYVLANGFGDMILVTGNVFGPSCRMLQDIVIGE